MATNQGLAARANSAGLRMLLKVAQWPTFVVNELPLDLLLRAILDGLVRVELEVAELADANGNGG